MRWFECLLLWVLCVNAGAVEVFVIPVENPRPIYPSELSRAGIVGTVRVSFMVNADGSVSNVRILQSDHPGLSEASKVAIEKWLFKPWTVAGDIPSTQEVIAPMVFGLDVPEGVPQWLKELRCREVNESLVATVDYHWVDVPAFHYTRAYVSSGFFQTQISSEQRLAMIAKLNRRVPTIARQCLNNPVDRYLKFLPEDIRKLF